MFSFQFLCNNLTYLNFPIVINLRLLKSYFFFLLISLLRKQENGKSRCEHYTLKTAKPENIL